MSGGGTGGAAAGMSSGMFGSRNIGSGVSAGQRGFTGNNGLLQGNERFLRNSRRGQFVGADSSDLRNILGGAMAGLNNRRGNMNFGNFGRGGFGNNFNNNQDKQKKAVQTRTRVGFEAAGPSNPQLSATLTRRLNRSGKLQTVSPVEVEVVGGTAVLRGVVATDHDRALAEQVALLEAGIGQVQNELELPSETTSASLPPPSDSAREF